MSNAQHDMNNQNSIFFFVIDKSGNNSNVHWQHMIYSYNRIVLGNENVGTAAAHRAKLNHKQHECCPDAFSGPVHTHLSAPRVLIANSSQQAPALENCPSTCSLKTFTDMLSQVSHWDTYCGGIHVPELPWGSGCS